MVITTAFCYTFEKSEKLYQQQSQRILKCLQKTDVIKLSHLYFKTCSLFAASVKA
jgi:hypothetical protein